MCGQGNQNCLLFCILVDTQHFRIFVIVIIIKDSLIGKFRRNVVVIATAKLHPIKPELRFCAGSNPAHGVLEIRDGEDL